MTIDLFEIVILLYLVAIVFGILSIAFQLNGKIYVELVDENQNQTENTEQ